MDELNQKQIEEIKSIYNTFIYSDYGKTLSRLESSEAIKSREEMYKDYDKLKSIGERDLAIKLERDFFNAAVYNMRDGFVIGFMYALRLNGIS